ncbi:hypothetical protein AT246_05790 [Bartonella henselae]|nr:hypothetical protein AT243_03635 [Bartonella henselae]OLL49380.1 hypothetical protein AT247_00405 [Bartonella henselae]OLL50910.1 hypothetical protein AT241_06505 [Bartonella henselae]OLL58282.1 hypothetical protein AT246_05790 [Bartonella henselae]
MKISLENPLLSKKTNLRLALKERTIIKDYEISHEIQCVINDCIGKHTLEECIDLLYKEFMNNFCFLKRMLWYFVITFSDRFKSYLEKNETKSFEL